MRHSRKPRGRRGPWTRDEAARFLELDRLGRDVYAIARELDRHPFDAIRMTARLEEARRVGVTGPARLAYMVDGPLGPVPPELVAVLGLPVEPEA